MNNVLVWAIIENIVLIIVAGLLAYFVSPFCLTILILANTVKVNKDE
jgi:hypothetical protein